MFRLRATSNGFPDLGFLQGLSFVMSRVIQNSGLRCESFATCFAVTHLRNRAPKCQSVWHGNLGGVGVLGRGRVQPQIGVMGEL